MAVKVCMKSTLMLRNANSVPVFEKGVNGNKHGETPGLNSPEIHIYSPKSK